MFPFILLGVGVTLLILGFNALSKKRLIENTPTSKIRSIAMGPIEIFGKVKISGDGHLITPLSNKQCVYYKYLVEEYKRQGKHSRWVNIMSGTDKRHFFLDDGTGKVLVDSQDANIDLPKTYTISSGMFKSPPQEIINFLVSNNRNHASFFGLNKQMRFTEWALFPGQEVYVFGTADDNPFTKDGSAQKNEDDIMIQKGKSFFYISNKNEKGVLGKFRNQVSVGFIFGSLLIVAAISLMLYGG